MSVLAICFVAAAVALGALELLRRSPREERERRRAVLAREWSGTEHDLLKVGAPPDRVAELRDEILGP